jgi:NADPH:quinone reductase-like Zn-dependent oxidoreductase
MAGSPRAFCNQKTIMKTKVWQFDRAGGPENLVLRTVDQRDPGPGEVRVRVQSLSLNRADTLWLADTYIESPTYPSGIGYEIAGVVDAIGPGVLEFKTGDRVSNLPATAISLHQNFGQTAVLPARALMKTPPHFNPAEASSFTFAYLTGYFALLELARLRAGPIHRHYRRVKHYRPGSDQAGQTDRCDSHCDDSDEAQARRAGQGGRRSRHRHAGG